MSLKSFAALSVSIKLHTIECIINVHKNCTALTLNLCVCDKIANYVYVLHAACHENVEFVIQIHVAGNQSLI